MRTTYDPVREPLPGSHPVRKMKKNPSPDYFTAGKWTAKDLLFWIHKKTQRSISNSTLKRWRLQLDICPDDDNLYTDCDRDGLIGLSRWLQRQGKVKPYAEKFTQFVQQAGINHG